MSKVKSIFVALVLLLGLVPSVFAPESSASIGYEVVGDVVEIWNRDTTYYFNKTNGAQWVENPDQYWTRNIFSVGYYQGGEWNKIYSSDDLGTFNREIESDYETYVNATLWRDFMYNGYELRMGIRYHLKLDDTDLSVILYAENIDYRDYPVPIGFSWTVTDIDIPNDHNNDRIYINQTYYQLDGVFDVTFTNMQHDENGTTFYDSVYRISDYTEYLTLAWDHNLPYSVHIQGNGVQSEATVTWMVNAGMFQAGQIKQTTLYWADAEGDYIEVWGLTALNADPVGMTTNDTHIFVLDNDDFSVYIYEMDGTYHDVFVLPVANNAPYSITTDDTNLWVTDTADTRVYKYTMAGAAVADWATNALNADPYGIATDGTNLWITDNNDKAVYKYDMAGSYIGTWALHASNTGAFGITTDGTNIWVSETSGDLVYKYNMAGTYVTNWALTVGNDDPWGITQNDMDIWITDTVDTDVYVYVLSDITPINTALASDADFSKEVYGWVNATVWDGNGVTNLKTVDIQVNTTGDAETFTLRWTQSSNVFSEVTDLDEIVTLGTSVRVNLNATTDKIAFNFTMTGGTDGLVDVKVTTIDDANLSDADVFANEFTYQTYVWAPLKWLVDSAADLLGGPGGFVDLIVTYATGVYVYVTDALTNMLSLIVQIFRVINGTFTFILNWFTRIVSLLVSIFTISYNLWNGTHSVLTDAINVWTLINFDTWVDIVPVFILISWMESLDKRGKIQGWNTVFIGDVSSIINILSFFSSMFSLIINTSIDFAFRFVDMIQSV